jgi:cytochrome o ubiquinol oxidase subunit 2
MRKNLHRLVGLPALCLLPLLAGCSWNELIELFPAGAVGGQQRLLIIVILIVMLFIFIPVVSGTLFFIWRYRASNASAKYSPNFAHSKILEVFIWGGPITIAALFAFLTFHFTSALDPYKPIQSQKSDPVQVKVIGMDWKWLFIYPKYGIASVNELAMPVNTPVRLQMTSDTVMVAFMVPQLGSQYMVMPGMRTQMNLMPTRTGKFYGKNFQYNGNGFSKEKFDAVSMSEKDFKAWVKKVKSSDKSLTWQRYSKLTLPSLINKDMYFSSVDPHLFRHVIHLYHTDQPRNRVTKLAHSHKPSYQQHTKTAEK